MTDAQIAAAAAIAVAVVTAVIGPIVKARVYRANVRKAVGDQQNAPPPTAVERRPQAVTPASATTASLAGSAPPTSLPDTPRLRLRESPFEVLEKYRSIPPLSRETVAKELFIGRWVQWTGVVKNVHSYSDSIRVSLMGVVPKGELVVAPWMFVDFEHSQRAELELLREEELLTFEARITRVSKSDIDLASALISAHGTQPSAG